MHAPTPAPPPDDARTAALCSSTVSVPAGTFDVETWTAAISPEETYTYRVEKAFPHRVIGWTGPRGERARLLGSKRLKYWDLNRNEDVSLLSHLGLKPVGG